MIETHDANATAPRPPFSAMFNEARHYRGDCALLRRAIRRKWLHTAPQAYRDSVMDCFARSDAVREEAGSVSSGQRIRVALAMVHAAIAWEAEAQRERHAVLDLVLGLGPEPSNVK